MSVVIEETVKRFGSVAWLVFAFGAGISFMYTLGLGEMPATAQSVENMDVRFSAFEETVSTQLTSLKGTDTHVRDDLEKIRINNAVLSTKLDIVEKNTLIILREIRSK